MQKPAETKKLYKIAAILYTLQIGLECLLFPVAAFLYAGNRNVQAEPGMAVMYFVPLFLALVYPLLAFWLGKQKEITPQSTKLTAILLPSCWAGLRLLSFGIQMLENVMLEAAQRGAFALLQSTIQILLKLTSYAGTAGFILLCCACAREYVLTHPASNGTKQLTKFAGICAAAGLLLQISSILFSEQVGGLFSSARLVLPLKWKLLLLGLTLFQMLPFAAAAIWFWLKPDSTRPMMRLIVSSVLNVVPGFLLMCANPLLIRLVAQEGKETLSAYAVAGSVSGFFGVLYFAALILICCAYTIAYLDSEQTPSDGESSTI